MESTINFKIGLRDRYILTQALVLGIEGLASVEDTYKESSNMEDMADMLMQPEFTLFVGGILLGRPGEPSPYPVAAAMMGDRMAWLTEALEASERLPGFWTQ